MTLLEVADSVRPHPEHFRVVAGVTDGELRLAEALQPQPPLAPDS